ncbi:glycosyltransferase family 2 protein [Aplosporella prunicola CBS 121167]|uniref:Glycosyltransferase family 2 protein n=1 Tax=Aplosporella prunicola CBS 121167 TaxID=1176127 RepID=A0A6A6B8E5_9PEZI|nr:glycosyltransferase family 2 protein [Aplosporella prunicola CBS 121167]KAF2139535.1 glycosyltransferase family 2 protein [Aplosporella prunicola CBS 121167]
MSQQHAQSRATPLEHQPSVSRSRQQGQSVVEDVVIPEHLLRMASVRRSWNLDHRGSSTYAADGPVQNIAQAQTQRLRPNLFRAASTGWYNRTTRAQPQRRPSQPTTRREVTSLSSTSSHESFRPKPQPATHRPESATQAEGSDGLQRRGTITRVVTAVIPAAVQQTAQEVVQNVRRSSMYDVYEKAKQRGTELQRKQWVQYLFEYAFYTFLIIFIYLVLVGLPLWKGAVYWLWWVVQNKFVIEGGYAITIGLAALYAFSPLLVLFEKDPPMPNHPEGYDLMQTPGVANTALLIPCYKSAGLIAKTLEAAVKIFPPQNIFVIANGNSPTPLDNTEEVCRPYGVNHVWSPVGSKIVAQFVGAYAAKGFKDVLLIDDDCALPPNFPIVSDRLTGKVQCIGYTIKSVGPESSKGTFCQQAQDLEYKISGLQRALAGKIGSATFPHGAISLWDREFLIKTFHDHPGFSVSEDWFFGHSCRRLGGRIKMCTSVFVETETPPAVFFSSGGSRGGFGEMTIFKQRFMRWNFFFVNGMWYDMAYILTSWNLGWWEIGAKLFVFQEVYETLLYLLTPFVLPISFIVRPSFCGYLLASTVVLYLINVVIFNEVHLRLKKERVAWSVLIFYYMPYKIVLTFINVASCYWSLYKYARYFAKRHPKVIEDEKAVEVVLRLEERPEQQKQQQQQSTELGRRLTVTAPVAAAAGVEEFDFAEKRKTSMARSMV